MDYIVDNYLKKGEILYTNAINKALEECSKTHGRVIFKKNHTYISGTIFLKDNVTLLFEENAKLKMSNNVQDFCLNKEEKIEALTKPTWEDCSYNGNAKKYFIFGNNVKNVSIIGNGIIDGNEEIFYGKRSIDHIDGYFYPRVPLICFIDSNNINLKNFTIMKSAFWTIHIISSFNIDIDNIKIFNNRIFANCDGIDLDHSHDITIKNSIIEAADDCIVLKSTSNYKDKGDTYNIKAIDCILKSTSSALKIGTETVSNFYNIEFENIYISDSNRGISLQLRDEGNIYDVNFKNIYIETKHFAPLPWWGKAEPIFISANKRYLDKNVGTIKNINFKNISCISENGICIYGDNNINISNINFNNINLKLTNKTNYEKGIHDIRPCEGNYLINKDLNSIYIENAKEINFKNYVFNIDDNIKMYYKKEKELINVSNIKFNS